MYPQSFQKQQLFSEQTFTALPSRAEKLLNWLHKLVTCEKLTKSSSDSDRYDEYLRWIPQGTDLTKSTTEDNMILKTTTTALALRMDGNNNSQRGSHYK